MRALGRFGGGAGDCTGRSRLAGTRSYMRATIADASATGGKIGMIDHLVNSPAHIVGNVQRAVGSDGHAAGAMRGSVRRLHPAGKTIGEYFAGAAGTLALERLVHHVVAALRIGRAIPGAMKGDEQAALVALGKLLRAVVHHSIGRPMRWERRNRRGLLGAHADLLAAVAAVFRREHQFLLHDVVVTLRPAVIAALFQQ